MPLPRVALALPLLALACSPPAASPKPEASEASAKPAAEPAKPPRKQVPRKKLPPKITPPASLTAKDLPPAPPLASATLELASEGRVALPEGIGVVLPHAALQLEQGLLLAGQAFEVYDPQIRATEVWHYQAFVPTSGEPRSSQGESGSIRTGALDGRGGALLVGSLGVGLEVRAWAGRINSDGSPGEPLVLDSPNHSDALTLVMGGPADELAVLAGFADAMAWMLALDSSGAKRWSPQLDDRGGFPQLRALARVDAQALLGVGVVAQRDGDAWWVRMTSEGSEQARGTITEFEGTPLDRNRMLYALVDRGEAGLVALGLAKRAVVQDHDQVFAVGFDRGGAPTWARTIDVVRAKQIRGATSLAGAALFVLEVPSESGSALALLRIAGPEGGELRVEAIAGSEGKRAAGFVQGAATPELLIADTSGTLAWQRAKVSP